MNVLHIDEQRGWRGGEQQASYLIQGLVRRGHSVSLAGRPGGPFLSREHGAPTAPRLALPLRGEFDLFSAWRIARHVRDQKIDILHAHTSHAHSIACLARAMARRGKVVVSRRVDFVPKHSLANRVKYGRPDRYVAISRAIERILLEFGVAAGRVRMVHSAIDPGRFDVAPRARGELGIPETAPLIGNVAALVGHKDQATLLRAMAHVLKSVPEARLLVAGEGPLRAPLEAQAAALGIRHAVHWLGYRDDVPQLLRALDCFVLSSKEEGLGTSVLDAMAAGCPVAACAAGGIPEMVIDGETGLLVPSQAPEALAGAIVRILGDAALRQRLVASARAKCVAEFSVDAMVAGNLAVYEELVRAGD